MTKRKSTPANGVSTTTHRQLKVKQGYYDYQSRQQYTQRAAIGEILLKGKWLVEAGFEINAPITVQVKRGKLILTVQSQ